MGFKEAVRICMQEKYVTFSGRAPRSEYWWFILFTTLVSVVVVGLGVATLNFSTGDPSTLSWIFFGLIGLFYLAVALPMISVTVRRFHDRNLSGWWYLATIVVGAVPYLGFLASIAALIITILRGTPGDNNFGPDPLNPRNSAEVFA
ncbi:DUF805 domain-containing protein [Paracoccus aminovorans]|uniref:DUF805 domain-containing protein n=1 Tax=Paracoccus aminovorans TaxID=34004 RepID=UPI002B25D7AA|nr:DUF805 domain-containing protein [Paracoccus aminovorans]